MERGYYLHYMNVHAAFLAEKQRARNSNRGHHSLKAWKIAGDFVSADYESVLDRRTSVGAALLGSQISRKELRSMVRDSSFKGNILGDLPEEGGVEMRKGSAVIYD